jgi:hypothetical protein
LKGRFTPERRRHLRVYNEAMGNCLTLSILVLSLILAPRVFATEIYHWVDENGVQNFSQNLPTGDVSGVSRLNLPDTRPSDFDPEEDRYGTAAQAERMSALREEMAERREAARERRERESQQQVVRYQEPVRRYAHPYWYPPIYPRPPLRPEPPIAVPYLTPTVVRPGR